MRILGRLIAIIITMALCVTTFVFVAWLSGPQLKDIATAGEWGTGDIDLDETSVRSLVYDANGDLMAAWFREDRAPIDLGGIPDVIIEAILATEDADFYQHKGINLSAIGRAMVSNVDAGGISQGGSTITQQLIKNLVLSSDQNIERKVQEAALAFRLEQQMTKDEILEEYLNTVYFGSGAYGVRAASEVYFGRQTTSTDPGAIEASLRGTTWADAALLAALISNPTAHDPFLFPETAREQRDIVLDRLAELEIISEVEAKRQKGASLPLTETPLATPPEDFYTAQVRKLLLEDEYFLGGGYSSRNDLILGGGLRIYTSFDSNVQSMAEQARDEMRAQYNIPPELTISIAAIDPQTGQVKAMVAGENFLEEQFNLATQGVRQPGSSFKTFVLTAAIKQGFTAEDRVNGKGPCVFRGLGEGGTNYEAENFSNSPGAIASLEALTLSSSNCGYLRLGQLVGNDQVIATAKSMGIKSPLFEVASLPLGVWEVTPMEMANAYATLASGGMRVEPYYIERIEDYNGNPLYLRENDPRFQPIRALAENVACQVTQVLDENTISGTGASIGGWLSQPSAGKTGTTENFEDAWFVGFTPYLATAVWIGNPDERQRMVVAGTEVTGGFIPAETFGRFNAKYHQGLPIQGFPACAPVERKPEYQRLPGDPELASSPCAPGIFALDYGFNGTVDNCNPSLPVGFAPCSYEADFVDANGNPITIYCGDVVEPTPTPEPEDGGLDGDGDIDGDLDGLGDDAPNRDDGALDGGGDGAPPPPVDTGGGGDGGGDGAPPPPVDTGGGGDGGGADGGELDGALDGGL